MEPKLNFKKGDHVVLNQSGREAIQLAGSNRGYLSEVLIVGDIAAYGLVQLIATVTPELVRASPVYISRLYLCHREVPDANQES